MKLSTIALLSFFLLFVSLPVSLSTTPGTTTTATSTTTPLENLCNNLGGFYVTYDYCFSAFLNDSRSKTADNNLLAFISLNLTITKATHVESAINALLNSTTLSSTKNSSESVTKALQTCMKLYEDLIPSLKLSARSVSSGRYDDGAKASVDQALNVPASCELLTGQALSKENDDFSRIALLSRAVVYHLAN